MGRFSALRIPTEAVETANPGIPDPPELEAAAPAGPEPARVEAAPPVSVSAPPETKPLAPVGVRFTEPLPPVVKLPLDRMKAMSVDDAVVTVLPAL